MEDLTVKDIEFLIEMLDGVDIPKSLSGKYAKETIDKLKNGSFEDMLKAVASKSYITDNADRMKADVLALDEEVTLLRAKLIHIRRSKQTAANG